MSESTSARRAVLIAGGISRKQCHPRYANDLAWWAGALVARNFECRVCYGDGTQLGQLASFSPPPLTASRADVNSAFKWLSGASDLALVLASNHGGQSGLCLWGADVLTPSQLGGLLGPSSKDGPRRVLIMGQCHAGVFGSLADSKTVVLSATDALGLSWACAQPPGPGAYDEFIYQLGTALFGAPADAPQVGPSTPLTLGAAFSWAKQHDRQKDAPELFDPSGLAATISL